MNMNVETNGTVTVAAYLSGRAEIIIFYLKGKLTNTVTAVAEFLAFEMIFETHPCVGYTMYVMSSYEIKIEADPTMPTTAGSEYMFDLNSMPLVTSTSMTGMSNYNCPAVEYSITRLMN